MGSFQAVDTARHEYGVGRTQGAVSLVIGVVFVAVVLPLGYLAATDADRNVAHILGVLGAVLLLTGAYLLAWAVRSQLILEGSRITVRGILDERTYDLSELEGSRTIYARHTSIPVICLKGGGRPIDISRYGTDDAFREWFGQLTDLDERDRKAVLDEISQSQELGATPEERMDSLARAKRWSVTLSVIAGAAAIGYLFGPESARLASAAVLWITPIAVLMFLHRSHLLYAIFKQKRDPRAELSIPLILAALALIVNVQDINLISWMPLLPWMVIASAAFILMFYRAVHSNLKTAGATIALLIFALFYGIGTAISADTAADGSKAEVYRVHVMRKYIHVTSGRHRTTTYYLVTEPWGPYEAPIQEMKVSGGMYRNTSEGDLVCIGLRPGLLHAPWFEPVACD